ncbi:MULTISPECIES: LptF/LptG family permease [unclassified Lentimicrobium]|uniref:LptF/LptG family permease n=1 Tax=unclassified Lentimicrobium TaxID=2677434 RepID=UPI001554D046|nr:MULTISPECIES: LptF/LptG family permease [unclassified Lentimicrobium]NPD46689.1 YjgP/YjgQ family permease [Lentimicrobium sp. S6]NPD85536.1 YjgP/YjgQ family permease [Lentimicrobium sp. L6]
MLKKIDRYIIKKFLGTFFYAITLLAGVIIVFDLSEKIQDLLENKAPLYEIIFSYYLNFLPYFINLFSYLFVFISVIFFTSKLATNTEIIAILSSGVSFRRLLRPYMIAATFLALMSFVLGNFVIPHTNVKMREFKQKYISNLKMDRGQNIHFQISRNNFVYVERYDERTLSAMKFSLEQFDDDGSLIYKLNSGKAIYDTVNNNWKIKDFYIREIDGLKEVLTKGSEMDTTLALIPKDLILIKEDYEVMDFFEINKFIKDQKMKGAGNVIQYEVEQQKRTAYPFAALILTLIGVSLSSRKVRGGMGMHLGLGIALTFIYILFMQFATVFAVYGGLSPILAAWIPNIVFSFIAFYLVRNAPK